MGPGTCHFSIKLFGYLYATCHVLTYLDLDSLQSFSQFTDFGYLSLHAT